MYWKYFIWRFHLKNSIGSVFRQGSMEAKRLVTINYLSPEKMYLVKKMNGELIATSAGSALHTKGFEVVLNNMYDGELFEISQLPQ